MTEQNISLRPSLKFSDIPLPKGQIIHRLEHYRTKNPWYIRPIKGKYKVRLLALTDKAVYDITEFVP